MANNNINWLENKATNSQSQPYKPTMRNPTGASKDVVVENFPINIQGPPLATDRAYIPGYLASNIGKNVRAEFVIGTSNYVDKTGKLMEVGANYFVLEDVNSHTNIMCDLYSVKFVTILL